jgi:hypothetical protein
VRRTRESAVIGLEFELMPENVRGGMQEYGQREGQARTIVLNRYDDLLTQVDTVRRLYAQRRRDGARFVRMRVIRD